MWKFSLLFSLFSFFFSLNSDMWLGRVEVNSFCHISSLLLHLLHFSNEVILDYLWGRRNRGNGRWKPKSKTWTLTFIFGSALFWLEMESNSVFALHLLILCKPSTGFLTPFVGMDFGMLELKSYLHQRSRSYSLAKIPFGACGVTMADGGTID